MNWVLASAAAVVLFLGPAQAAQAATLDCTSGCNFQNISGIQYGTGTLFSTTAQGAGTGNIDPFVRIQANNLEDGVNTSVNKPLNDEKTGIWTHDIQLGSIPVVTINNVAYYEFFLDINQNTGGNNELLSLNAVQICLGSLSGVTATNTCPTPDGTFTKYDILGSYSDGSVPYTGDYVKMDYSLNNGSGSGDLFMYVPVSTLGSNYSDWLYLFSQFGAGGGFTANDGFEEWTVQCIAANPNCSVAPEPASLILFGSGLAGLAAIVARRRRVSK